MIVPLLLKYELMSCQIESQFQWLTPNFICWFCFQTLQVVTRADTSWVPHASTCRSIYTKLLKSREYSETFLRTNVPFYTSLTIESRIANRQGIWYTFPLIIQFEMSFAK